MRARSSRLSTAAWSRSSSVGASPAASATASRAPVSQESRADRDDGGEVTFGSAADLAHRAAGSDEAGVVDFVLQLLVRDRPAEERLELGLGGAFPKRCLEVPLAT